MNLCKFFRWSLRTQVIAVLFVGYGLVLWEWREPWRFSREFQSSKNEYGQIYSIAPDSLRFIGTISNDKFGVFENSHFSMNTSRAPCLQLIVYKGEAKLSGLVDPRFQDNDTIVVLIRVIWNDKNVGEYYYAEYRRRFPEWWWGHFYRPEVWLLPLWLGLIVWTVRKDRAVAK